MMSFALPGNRTAAVVEIIQRRQKHMHYEDLPMQLPLFIREAPDRMAGELRTMIGNSLLTQNAGPLTTAEAKRINAGDAQAKSRIEKQV